MTCTVYGVLYYRARKIHHFLHFLAFTIQQNNGINSHDNATEQYKRVFKLK